jgi:hypothetical protein
LVDFQACDSSTGSGVVHLHVFAGAGVFDAEMIFLKKENISA